MLLWRTVIYLQGKDLSLTHNSAAKDIWAGAFQSKQDPNQLAKLQRQARKLKFHL